MRALLLSLVVLPTSVAVATETSTVEEPGAALVTIGGASLAFGGYGEIAAGWLGYGPNQNREGGSQEDSRVVLDTSRFVLGIELELPAEFDVDVELEFEHGGVGAAMELEYEEFGEFEADIEQGGEVRLEELELSRSFGNLEAAIGRFPVAFGLLSERHRPTERLRPQRAEGEQRVIPAVWSEIGLALEYATDGFSVTAQLVNGLDSTGFSSQGWVATGQQRRFETVLATAPAGVLRVQIEREGLLVGATAYHGGTTRNRAKPDIVPECDSTADAVAPCGVIAAPVTLVGGYADVSLHGVTARASAGWGTLARAELISERNSRLSNNLDVLRTAVADTAWYSWAELGYDLARHFAGRTTFTLSPWVAAERYDTMGTASSGRYDNPRYERQIVAAGLQSIAAEHVSASLGWSTRVLGSSEFRREQSVDLGVGFVF
jgi:hypothetical protein